METGLFAGVSRFSRRRCSVQLMLVPHDVPPLRSLGAREEMRMGRSTFSAAGLTDILQTVESGHQFSRAANIFWYLLHARL